MKMTAKERAELKRLTRRILLHQKVTRGQILRAFELRQQAKSEAKPA